MANLYELVEGFQQVQDMIENGEEGLQDTLESIDLSLEDKIEQTGRVIQNMKAEVEALKNEEKRLSDKRKSIEVNIDRLRNNIETGLAAKGTDKLKTDVFTFAMQNNGPRVKIHNDAEIPGDYFIEQEPKLDKKSLKETLKSSDIPGVELVQEKSLRIK